MPRSLFEGMKNLKTLCIVTIAHNERLYIDLTNSILIDFYFKLRRDENLHSLKIRFSFVEIRIVCEEYSPKCLREKLEAKE